jgi:two-component system cell cycle sensor histidine kinase/response regulator CckA
MPLLRTLAGGSIRLEVRLGAELPPFRGDASQLEHMLLNLAVNAKDAMPQGGTMTVETAVRQVGDREAARLDTPAGSYVEIALGDTGTGMPPEVMAHLFEPFYTTKPVGQGTGLGLSTVNGIMRQHGGAVSVKSVEGEGSRFALLFPAIAPVGPPPEAPLLLLVDDDHLVRMPVARLLRRHGFGVLEAGSGVEALELWARRGAGVSAVVSDIVMPGMTGPVLLRELRRQRPDLPALLVTGYSADALRDRGGLELDAVLLEKPFDSATLLQRIRDLLPPVPAR